MFFSLEADTPEGKKYIQTIIYNIHEPYFYYFYSMFKLMRSLKIYATKEHMYSFFSWNDSSINTTTCFVPFFTFIWLTGGV